MKNTLVLCILMLSLVACVGCKKPIDKTPYDNMTIEEKNTALIETSSYGQIAIVTYLVENGADINTKNEWSWSALMVASYNGQLEVVKYLVNKGAKVNWKHLMKATENGHTEIVRILINKGASVDRNHLMIATNNGHTEIIKLLKDVGLGNEGKLVNHG